MESEDWLLIRFYLTPRLIGDDLSVLESLGQEDEFSNEESRSDQDEGTGVIAVHVMGVANRTRDELRQEIANVFCSSKLVADAFESRNRNSLQGPQTLGIEGERFPTQAEAEAASSDSCSLAVALSNLPFPELHWIDEFLGAIDL